jgi:hypothetical protein
MLESIEETTGSLNEIGGIKIDPSIESSDEGAYYFVDYSKLASVNDLMIILSAVGFNFHTTHPHFDAVKPFLDLEHPVKPIQTQR